MDAHIELIAEVLKKQVDKGLMTVKEMENMLRSLLTPICEFWPENL